MSLLGAVKGIVARVTKTVGGVVPGPIGAVSKVVGSKLSTKTARAVIKGTAIAGGTAAALGTVSAMSGGHMFGAARTRRYRRVNPGNTRAMRRAVRRIEAGAKLYSKFFKMHHGGIHKAPGVRLKRHSRRAA